MPSDATNDATRADWRELGFFYDVDHECRQWRLVGSRRGLLGFAQLLDRYVADPANRLESEHEHYGPYMYLEVMTAKTPGIDGHSIHGTLADLTRLASITRTRISDTQPGQSVVIKDDYAVEAQYSLVLQLRPGDFDPSSADAAIASA
jgi:hypothetical protein